MDEQTLRPAVPLTHPDAVEHRRQLAARANASLPHDGTAPMTAPMKLVAVTVADLASDAYAPAMWPGGLVYVSNETGGAVPAWSDGSDWRRVSDGNVVS